MDNKKWKMIIKRTLFNIIFVISIPFSTLFAYYIGSWLLLTYLLYLGIIYLLKGPNYANKKLCLKVEHCPIIFWFLAPTTAAVVYLIMTENNETNE